MKSFQTPKDGSEWMRQVNRRLSLIERHRHPGNANVTPPAQDITTNKWFRASVAGNPVVPIAVDGLVKVPLDVKADPYGMLDAQFRFVPPRSGPFHFMAGTHVQLNTTDPGARANVHGVIVDLDASNFWMIRGSQHVNNTDPWTAGGGIETVLSGIVEVVAGHHYEFQCNASAANVTKQFALSAEDNYFTGAYADSGDPIRQFPISGSAELSTWTPSITTTGNPFTWGTGAIRKGYWRWVGPHHLRFTSYYTIGSGADGGSGMYLFDLPPWGTIDRTIDVEQVCRIKVYTGSNGNYNYNGSLVISASGAAGAGVAAYLDGASAAVASGSPALGNNSNFALSGDIFLAG